MKHHRHALQRPCRTTTAATVTTLASALVLAALPGSARAVEPWERGPIIQPGPYRTGAADQTPRPDALVRHR